MIYSGDDSGSYKESSAEKGISNKEKLLQEQIESLERDKVVLQEQFKVAIQLSEKSVALQSENSEMKEKIRVLQQKNDDLENRLVLSAEQINKIAKDFEADKRATNLAFEEEIESLKSQSKIKEQEYGETIDHLEDQIQELNNNIDSIQLKSKFSESNIEHLLTVTGQKMNQQFSSLEDVINVIRNIDLYPKENEESMISISKPKDDDESIQVIEKYKRRAIHYKNMVLELEYQINELNTDLQTSNSSNRIHIQTLESQLEELKKENLNQKQLHEKETESLNSRIQSLNEKLLKPPTNPRTPLRSPSPGAQNTTTIFPINQRSEITFDPISPIRTPSPQQNQNTVNPENEIKKLQKEVRERLTEAEEQIKLADNQRKEFLDRIQSIEQENSQLQIELYKQQTEYDNINMLYKESQNQIENLRESLKNSSNIQEVKPKRNTDNNRREIERLKKVNDDQTREMVNLQLEMTKLETQIKEERSKNRELNDRMVQLESRAKDLQFSLNEAKHRIDISKPSTIDDFLPYESWVFSKWEESLSKAIRQIVNNNSLQPTSKLQNVFNEIYQYYNQLLERVYTSLRETIEEKDGQIRVFDKFLIDLAISLTSRPISSDTFPDDMTYNDIIQSARELRNSHNDLKTKCSHYEKLLGYFSQSFETPFDPLSGESFLIIDQLKEKLNESQMRLASTRQKLNYVKKEYREASNAFKLENKALVSTNNDLNQQLKFLREKAANLSSDLEKQKEDVTKLTEELNETKRVNDMTQIENKEEVEQQLETIHMEYASRESQAKLEIDTLMKKNQELSDSLQQAEETIASLEEQLESTSDDNNVLLQKIEDMKSEHDQQSENTDKQNQEIVSSLKESYQNAINELTQNSEKQREDITILSQKIEQYEKRINRLNNHANRFKEEKRHLESDIKRMNEQMERQKLINHSETLSKIASTEAEFYEKLSLLKTANEQEKKQLMMFFAEKFGQFFNPSQPIDERTFKSAVDKANEEIKRLSKSDHSIRSMLKTKEKQTTEDSVAQFLISGQ